MKLAISASNNRIAPVFDVSSVVQIYEIESNKAVAKNEHELPRGDSYLKVDLLKEQQIEVIICGLFHCIPKNCWL